MIIGGVAWSEYQNAQQRSAAQAVGDGILNALQQDEGAPRLTALQDISQTDGPAQTVVDFLIAAEQANAGDAQAASETFQTLARDADLPLIYRQIAQFKALGFQADTATIEDRRAGYMDLAQPGAPLRLLAQEQLALLDIEAGDVDAALSAFQSIIDDAESTPDLQQRALQVMVALGGEPDVSTSYSGN